MYASRLVSCAMWGAVVVAFMAASAHALPPDGAPATPEQPQAKIIVFEVSFI